jgi:glycosyltransferase domain-containing protein
MSANTADDGTPANGQPRDAARLTVLIPTYNRPEHCAALLRFFRDCGLPHAIVVLDSSSSPAAERVRAACVSIAEYRQFEPTFNNKSLSVLRTIDTPFVVMVPDDDVTFPHAIDAALDHLIHHPGFAMAQGYTLRFGFHDNDVDVHSVYSFVPSVDQDDPLHRLFYLIRRYQPFSWAVFRREVLMSSLELARPFEKPLFNEMMFMNSAVLQGKVAMLPLIYAMRGMEASHSPVTSSHPLFAVLHDAQQFFADYTRYRTALADFIRARQLAAVDRQYRDPVSGNPDSRLEQLIDVVHGTWLAREADLGAFNHAAQLLLGMQKPLLRGDPVWPGGRPLGEGDLVHRGAGDRRYIWRREVLEAQPREEITIGRTEIATVEHQLDLYRLDQANT